MAEVIDLDNKKVFEKVRKIICDHALSVGIQIPKNEINMDTHFYDDLDFEVRDLIWVILEIHKVFDFEMTSHEVDDIRKVKHCVKMVNKYS